MLIKARDRDHGEAVEKAKYGAGGSQGRRGHRDAMQEVYRIKLPGNPVVGEGKPENQNHAIIFTRGEYVQAIDMNQEGWVRKKYGMVSDAST